MRWFSDGARTVLVDDANTVITPAVEPGPHSDVATIESVTPSSGPPGTPVVVRGHGFRIDSDATINGVKVDELVIASPLSFAFEVPALDAGTYTLRLEGRHMEPYRAQRAEHAFTVT